MRYAALGSIGLALLACNARQASRPVPFAVQDPRRTQLEYCAQQIALADGFQVSTERGTFLERPVADIRQQRKELLWLGSRVDGDTLRAMAHGHLTSNGAKRTLPEQMSPESQRVIRRINSECHIGPR
jgi:curli biogenesis system outer membrane secretion channel CsgG